MAAVHQSTPQEVIKLVATYLNSVVAENDKLPKLVSPTKFHARSVPSIDLLSYLSRILKYAPCGSECFLAVLVYFDRIANLSLGVSPADDLAGLKDSLEQTHISKTYKKVTINSYTIHRLLITASLVSMKFLSDVFYTNLHMSRVGGLPVHELNQLELEFLKTADFQLMVNVNDLERCGERLVEKLSFISKETSTDPSNASLAHSVGITEGRAAPAVEAQNQ